MEKYFVCICQITSVILVLAAVVVGKRIFGKPSLLCTSSYPLLIKYVKTKISRGKVVRLKIAV